MTAAEKNSNGISVYLIFIAFIAAGLLIYLNLRGLWFYGDDMQWIWFSAATPVFEQFFDGVRARYISPANFTPMLGLSFKTDWILFGISPQGYYVHSLLSLMLTSIAFYKVARLFIGRTSGIISTMFFLMSVPALSVVSWLSARHYLEGMFFSLISICLLARKKNVSKASSVMAGIFYLFAVLNKEVYVMLPFILFFIPVKGLKFQRMIPLWVSLLIYIPWRFYILEGGGGYPYIEFGFYALLSGVLNILGAAPVFIFGKHWIYPTVALFLLTLAGLRRQTLRKNILKFIILIIISVLPVALAGEPSERHYFHISVPVFIAIAFLGETLANSKILKPIVIICGIALGLMLFTGSRRFMGEVKERSKSAEAAAGAYVSGNYKYIRASQPFWFYEGLRTIYSNFFDIKIKTLIIPSGELLRHYSIERLMYLKENAGVDSIKGYQAALRPLPQNIYIGLEGYKLRWDFGPEDGGKYTVFYGPESGSYYYSIPFKRRGSLSLGLPGNIEAATLFLKVIYRSKEGWEASSPEAMFIFPGKQEFRY